MTVAATPQLAPVTFEQLLAGLRQDKLINAEQHRDLLARQESQHELLVQQLKAAEPGTDPSDRRRPVTVSPVDLLLSFRVPGPNGQPLHEDVVTEVYAKRAGLPYVKLDPLKLDPQFTTSVISKAFARQHALLALREEEGELVLATCNPFATWAFESVERVARKRLRLVVASQSDIQRIITEFYGFRKSVARAEKKLSAGIDLGNLEQFVRMKSEREIESSDEHVVHAVEYLLTYAFQQRASDIHIEPKRDQSHVRFRIDGALHHIDRLPRIVHAAVVNRVKTLSRLDIGEKRRPQDGRIKTEFNSKPVEIRVSTLPVAFGEKVVLRIFDPEMAAKDLASLGFFERELAIFERIISQPNGILLVTGPTGSGKTTTLYTALKVLATDEVNVNTIEDPIEMVFERINQTAVHPSIGITFASSLRTLLRQDPDIIMVGEIRDLDTARNAIQASLTGHLVLSTLHTNDAPSAVTRMLDLGVENFLLASTLSGVLAQRLLRKVCHGCAEERELTPAEIASLEVAWADQLAGQRVRYGEGCVECRQTGYFGRTAIYEMFELDDAIKALVMQRADAAQVKAEARRQGMLTLREGAVRKMQLGQTSYEEVMAVTREI
ncbi:MAG: type II/IV secretion system protein [Deltaproteobacteria bacterium]|jgi:general secretion pathway protein E|nr:type II/IV secretion system protein [Deltaproteobacteria bacterium]MBW2530886.1 type II/IV secretion system protein [Deltaproteobacteria bacterium]